MRACFQEWQSNASSKHYSWIFCHRKPDVHRNIKWDNSDIVGLVHGGAVSVVRQHFLWFFSEEAVWFIRGFFAATVWSTLDGLAWLSRSGVTGAFTLSPLYIPAL